MTNFTNDKFDKRSLSPLAGIRKILAEKQLVYQIAYHSLRQMYSGTVLGLFWSFARPLFLLIVYTLVFGGIFQAKFFPGKASGGTAEFAVILMLGLTIFGILSETLSRAPGLIVGNANFVKKVIFPIEILPVSDLFVVLVNAMFGFVVFILGYIYVYDVPPWYVVFLPITLLPLVLMALGVSYFISALSVYLRDAGQFVGILVSVLLFLSPIFYPIAAVPEFVRGLLVFNPLVFPLEASRDLIFDNEFPSVSEVSLYYGISLGVLWCGWAWFQYIRQGFADVL